MVGLVAWMNFGPCIGPSGKNRFQSCILAQDRHRCSASLALLDMNGLGKTQFKPMYGLSVYPCHSGIPWCYSGVVCCWLRTLLPGYSWIPWGGVAKKRVKIAKASNFRFNLLWLIYFARYSRFQLKQTSTIRASVWPSGLLPKCGLLGYFCWIPLFCRRVWSLKKGKPGKTTFLIWQTYQIFKVVRLSE